MNGFNVAEAGHVVQVIPPQSISGGVTGTPFNVKNCKHISIIVMLGVIGNNKPTAITLYACTGLAGAGKTAMPFRYYLSKSGGATIDLVSPPAITTLANTYGLVAADLSKINNEFIIIEVDAEEIDYLGDGNGVDYPYLELDITDSGNTTYASAIAILSGQRHAYQGGGPTVTS